MAGPTFPLPAKPLDVSSPSFVPAAAKQPAAASDSAPVPSRKRPAPASPPLNPTLVPVAPKPPRTAVERDETRRLIVVLEQACLETYKHSTPATSRGGKGEDKFSLLNCDDHQGVLAKMGRDIAHARPDITHQVRLPGHARGARTDGHTIFTVFFPLVPPHPSRLAVEQGWQAPGVYSHRKGRPHRGQPQRAHPANLQAVRRPYGFVSSCPRGIRSS